ncbi:transposase [Chitinophaga qingshengii]|uniref:Transposase n=1 Tax=Chitinophaga qingshengii TaxID=1569794 RepID=A0ABR7TWN0_9BACT|nr:transposase [Chitinophaga qingshengii]MBC9934485.1 transposase [Chitinophaga qingshengii]
MDTSVLFFGIMGALGYVLLQSLFILGVRVAAKGAVEKLPNGKDKDSEMILFPVFKYLTRVDRHKIYYSGEQFDQLIRQIRVLMPEAKLPAENAGIVLPLSDTSRIPVLKELNNVLPKIDGKIQVEVTDTDIRFFKIDEVFKVNKYLRKPVIQCPICMASYWSVFSYWIPIIYFYGFSFWVLYAGVINICAVSCMNWLLWMRGSAYEAQIMKG